MLGAQRMTILKLEKTRTLIPRNLVLPTEAASIYAGILRILMLEKFARYQASEHRTLHLHELANA